MSVGTLLGRIVGATTETELKPSEGTVLGRSVGWITETELKPGVGTLLGRIVGWTIEITLTLSDGAETVARLSGGTLLGRIVAVTMDTAGFESVGRASETDGLESNVGVTSEIGELGRMVDRANEGVEGVICGAVRDGGVRVGRKLLADVERVAAWRKELLAGDG